MLVGKKTSIVVGVALILIIIGAILFYSQTQTATNRKDFESSDTYKQTKKAVLVADGYVSSSFWSRNTTTDLPDFVTNIVYSVRNDGNSDATNVILTVTLDGSFLTENDVSSLPILEVQTYYVQFSTIYDTVKTMQIQASCADSTDSYTLSIGSKFPRQYSGDPNVMKLFVTPNEGSVVNQKNSILKSKFFLTPDYMALRDWVGSNIKYTFDSESHGQTDYWQFSKETLSTETGDCEDSAILLCSLLRAAGVSANDVYVVVGETQGQGHAWVSFKWFTLLGQPAWIRMEPTAGGEIVTNFFTDLISTFENRIIYCSFNDLYYSNS